MRPERYFDNAATTPLDRRVLEAMLPWMGDRFGNAHSAHQAGRGAREAVEAARARVAALIGADDPSEVVFTSGATEANNWVISAQGPVWISPFEHSSVREPALRQGALTIANDGAELVGPAPDRGLVSVMLVNNETGAILDPERMRPEKGGLHSDVTQAVGKIDFVVRAFDLASFSAHKLHGPQGVGGLYARDALAPEPLLRGGGQEHGRRSGTLNVAGIVGFGAAAELAIDRREERHAKASRLRAIVIEALRSVPDHVVHEAPHQSPFILSVGFAGIEGAALVVALDQMGFAISAGAACSSDVQEPSPGLRALGVDPAIASGSVRISFGDQNTPEAANELGLSVSEAVKTLRSLKTGP